VKKRVAMGVLLAVGARVSTSAAAYAQEAAQAPETIAVGDWQLAPIAQVRARGEYRYDVDRLDKGLLVERARLGVDALRGAFEARVVLQDARAMTVAESVPPVSGPEPIAVTGAFEAWAEAHTSSIVPSFVRVGRQPVLWGEGRLLAVADWSPTARSLDAVRGRLVVGDLAFEALAAALVDPETSASLDNYAELLGARGEWAIDPLFAVEVYGLARIAQGNPTVNADHSVRGETYTAAARLHGDAHALAWGAEGAYQFGRATDLQANRSAWAAAAHLAYAFEHLALVPLVQVGGAYASGNDDASSVHAFDPLLPDVHVWHGAMDLFAWSNEWECSARVGIVPWTDSVASVEYRYASLARPGAAWISGYLETIGLAAGNQRSELGNEIDATLRWSPWVPVELAAGYSMLVLGGGARAILAARAVGSPLATGALSPQTLSHYAFAQATVSLP
jgi:hypothetical protein